MILKKVSFGIFKILRSPTSESKNEGTNERSGARRHRHRCRAELFLSGDKRRVAMLEAFLPSTHLRAGPVTGGNTRNKVTGPPSSGGSQSVSQGPQKIFGRTLKVFKGHKNSKGTFAGAQVVKRRVEFKGNLQKIMEIMQKYRKIFYYKTKK